MFTYGVPLAEYKCILGEPTRSESPGPPAPYGHRNNVLHFYDELGFILYEHHATYLISSIVILLDPLTSTFPTSSPYSGELWVCGVKVHAGMRFNEFARQCEVEFKPVLGHQWFLDGKHMSILFEVVAPSRKRGTRKTAISEVAVGFEGAHRFSVVK